MSNNDNRVTIVCPPYPEFKEAPEDQPHSELRDCPKCHNKMWISGKKRGLLMFCSCAGKDILLACYDCFKKIAKEDPSSFLDSNIVEV